MNPAANSHFEFPTMGVAFRAMLRAFGLCFLFGAWIDRQHPVPVAGFILTALAFLGIRFYTTLARSNAASDNDQWRATQDIRFWRWKLQTVKDVCKLDHIYIERHTGQGSAFQGYAVTVCDTGYANVIVTRFAFCSSAEEFANWLRLGTGLPVKSKEESHKELNEVLEKNAREIAVRRKHLAKGELKTWDAFTKAIRTNSPKKVLRLTTGGLQLHARDPDEQMTPLLWAVEFDRVEIARLLIDAGADVNLVGDSAGTTPLMSACSAINVEMVELLLERGAQAGINRTDKLGETALMGLCYGDLDERDPKSMHHLLSLLLTQGADPSIPNKDEDTPLAVAEEMKRDAQFIERLRSASA